MGQSTITRPGLFAVCLAVAMAAFAAAGWSLWDLRSHLLAEPMVVAVDRAALPAALEDAPYIASGDGADVWVLVTPDCPKCRALENGTVARLVEAGVDVRLVIVAPRGADFDDATLVRVAGLAAERDWDVYLKCFTQAAATCQPRALEPAAREGYLEWGRAAIDRVAAVADANDSKLTYPAIFWRRGKEWRAIMGADPRGLGHLTRDFDLNS